MINSFSNNIIARSKTLHKRSQKMAHGLIVALVLVAFNQYSPVTFASKSFESLGVDGESLVLRCVNQCDDVAGIIESLGGTVNVRYANINALAIKVPIAVSDRIASISGVAGVGKDALIAIPYPKVPIAINQVADIDSTTISSTELEELLYSSPANYNFNNQLTGASTLHQAGQLGEGVVVAVIDSGVANNPGIVNSLSGSVIGGENFVPGAEEPSATSTYNDSHGTMVATMIAGHGALNALNTSPFIQAVLKHAPDSVFPLNSFASTVPLIGTAPGASIYAMKIFPADGGGARTSTILTAMDRALSLKRNFDAGEPVVPVSGSGSENDPYVYDSLNIQVVNLSLGGATLIPGLGLEDVFALEMLANGITVVAATGNEGPASLTGGAPGTSVAAISVGAASTAAHDRIWLDTDVEPGFGDLYRASDAPQIADFSSRGPTADGRRGVDVVANGMGSFVQGADGYFYMVAGSSFSAPTVAGVAALLRGANPTASATEIRSAIIKSANDDLLEESASKIDQGRGFLNVPKALAVLNKGKANDKLPKLPKKPKRPVNIDELIEEQDVEPIEFEHRDHYSVNVNLIPGEVEHILVPTGDKTASITVNISNIQPELPFEEQNQLFGDDLYLTVVDAPTSYNETLISDFFYTDSELEFAAPQHGYMRLAVMGDITNAGKISAKVTISEQKQKPVKALLRQGITDGLFDSIPVIVEPGVASVNFELDWKGDWGHYPVNDLDLILVDPHGNLNFDGATLRVPEQLEIADPAAGVWTLVVDGYQLHGTRDRYTLRAYDELGNNLQIAQ